MKDLMIGSAGAYATQDGNTVWCAEDTMISEDLAAAWEQVAEVAPRGGEQFVEMRGVFTQWLLRMWLECNEESYIPRPDDAELSAAIGSDKTGHMMYIMQHPAWPGLYDKPVSNKKAIWKRPAWPVKYDKPVSNEGIIW